MQLGSVAKRVIVLIATLVFIPSIIWLLLLDIPSSLKFILLIYSNLPIALVLFISTIQKNQRKEK